MKVYRHIADFNKISKAIVTTGTFDGVHLGHQKIFKRLKEIAVKEKGETVVLSFYPHPRMVLFPHESQLRLLTTIEEKILLLQDIGIDHFVIHPFTPEFSKTSAMEYVKDILVDKIGVAKLVIGYDHHFGRNREGTLENLKILSKDFNFEVEEIPAQEIDDVNVSSTKIRNALQIGDVETANSYLSYYYSLTGKVVNGNKLGRDIGFPTANIEVEGDLKLIPLDGVYAARVKVGEENFGGMVNIGFRPTIQTPGQDRKVEIHILDFNREIYGEVITISFVKRIRDEQKFPNINALKNQLEQDRIAAVNILGQ